MCKAPYMVGQSVFPFQLVVEHGSRPTPVPGTMKMMMSGNIYNLLS